MKFRSKCFIAAATALVAQTAGAASAAAQPGVQLFGGGATFPINAYVGDTWLDYSPQHRLSNTFPSPVGSTSNVNDNAVGSTSLFKKFALSTVDSTNYPAQKFGHIGVSYCQAGSGVGRGIMLNSNNATAACGDYSTGTPVGVSGTARKGDFGGSDAPLSQTNINTFNTSTGTPAQQYSALYNQMVQLPAVAGGIAIVYNNVDATRQINLTRSDVCGIFSGRITNWNQLTHTPGLAAIPSKAIKVVVRSDNSGTTFSFSNFLSAACPTVDQQPGGVKVTTFNTSDQQPFYTNVFPTSTPPAGLITASGNGGIVSAVAATDGAIGYADVADTLSRNRRSGGTNLQFAYVSYAADVKKGAQKVIPPGGADVTCPGGQVIHSSPSAATSYQCPAVVYNKLGPGKNLLPSGATGLELNVSYDKVLTTNVSGRPGVANVSYANWAAGVTPAANCLALVLPNDYAQPPTAATSTAPADFATYPIIAVSYLLTTAEGNGAAKADGLRRLLKAPYDPAILAGTKTMGGTTGFAPLVLKNNGSTVDVDAFLAACIRN